MASSKPTAEAFLATVKKSGLVEPDRLQKALADFEGQGGDPQDSLAIAEFLVDAHNLSKWQAEKLLQGKHKGYFLGKYRLISLLGKGGMSSVFLAEHVLMRRRCAIKVLPTRRVADSSYLARFHREAQAVAALDHPNIVRAYDVDHQTERDAEIHFLVMEYVEGQSLQELVARNGVADFADAVDYIRQASLGLEHAHRAGMVHRDIKPGNLLVDRNGTVKLLDLGLARYFSTEEIGGTALTIAHDEKVLGTADYLAPEQALDSHTVDHRADIYSLGCTLYFLLTGHPPFTEGTLTQRLMAHQTKEPPPVETDRPDTPASLSAILRKLMAKKPEDRYATAEEVASVLLQWLADHADNAWKQSHSQLLGGLRGSDTTLAAETAAVPAKTIPVAKPVVLTMYGADEERDTEIVTHSHWPTGDLTTSATEEKEPELSAFLAQVESDVVTAPPQAGGSSKKISAKATGRSVPAAKPAADSPGAAPNFDFLSGSQPVAMQSADTAIGQVAPPKKAAPAKVPTAKTATPKSDKTPVKQPPAPVVEPPVAQPIAATDAAFPHFDFVSKPVAEPPAQAASQPAPVADSGSTAAVKPNLSGRKVPPVAWIAGGVAGLVLLFALYALLFSGSGSSGKPRSRPEPVGPWTQRTITVHGDRADFQSLQEALLAAQKRFQPNPSGVNGKPDLLTIIVAAGTYEEAVRIDGSKFKTPWPDGIVIRGEGDVVLKPDGDGPVLSLDEVTSLALENVTIDAGQKPVAMEMSGWLTGCRLSNVRLQGFSAAGLVLRGVHAFGDPLQVDNIRCDSKSDSAVGIRIGPEDVGGTMDDCSEIVISGSRFDGPLLAGIAIQGSTPRSISIRESIFANPTTGIRFEGPGRWQDFVIANNTFFHCPTGIAWTVMPDPLTSGLAIRRNLFVGTDHAEAVVQAGFNEGAFAAMLTGGVEWNWSDRAAPATPSAGFVNLFANNGKRGEPGFAFASSNPEDPRFLEPTQPSPQRSAPNPQGTDQPWVGALGP